MIIIAQIILICFITINNVIPEVNSLHAKNSFCEKLKEPNYQVFSTLTLYESSKKYLDQDFANKSPLPEFGEKTLQEEHDKLTSESCKPISFYFLGRHAARFPKDDKIEKHNNDLYKLNETLRELVNKLPGHKNENCDRLLNWRSKLTPKQGYLITELGGQEEQNIAKRYKQVYPEFFDVKTTEIDVGVTSKIRTAQTEVQFMKLVDGYYSSGCENVPTNNINEKEYNPQTIIDDKCYRKLMEKEVENFLQFHQICKDRAKEKKEPKAPLVERLKSKEAIQIVLDRVSKRLGFDNKLEQRTLDSIIRMCVDETATGIKSVWCTLHDKVKNEKLVERVLEKRSKNSEVKLELDQKTLISIVRMCIHETAIGIKSVWCTLLGDEDIKAYDYLEDAESYFVDSYGPDSNIKMACPLVGNIIDVLESAMKQSDTLILDGKKKSYFYFTHDHALKRIIPYFGLFKDDESFSEKAIDEFIKDGKIPEKRRYELSKLLPFSSHFAFVVYRCQKDSTKPAEHKLLTTFNERPIRMAACKNQVACDLNSFIETYNDSRLDCDLNKICPVKK